MKICYDFVIRIEADDTFAPGEVKGKLETSIASMLGFQSGLKLGKVRMASMFMPKGEEQPE